MHNSWLYLIQKIWTEELSTSWSSFILGFEPTSAPAPSVPAWQGRSIGTTKLRLVEFSAFLEQQRDPESVSVALVSANFQLFSVVPHPLRMLSRVKPDGWNTPGVSAFATAQCNIPFTVVLYFAFLPSFSPICRSERPHWKQVWFAVAPVSLLT